MKRIEALQIPGEPAFKGSSFTAQEYEDVWGDTWESMYMHLLHIQPNDMDIPFHLS
jgi:hypothetical protein